ncbi:hypothetical protein ABPG72_009964 [Tetrahymena utriculariae]
MLKPYQIVKATLITIYLCYQLSLIKGSRIIPLRVTNGFSQIEKQFVNSEQKQHINLIISLFSQFLSQLLYVKPRDRVIKNDGFLYYRDTYIGQNGIDGYSNSDIVIVVSATNILLENFKVNYDFCKWDNKRIMMELRFQMRQFVKKSINYEVLELKRAFMYNGMCSTDNLNY